MTTLRTRDDASWEALVAEQADSAPGTFLQEGDVLNLGDGDTPGQMRVAELRFKGYVQVWDSRTGMESLQPWWLLWQTMRKHRPDGSMVFTRTNPHIAPKYGEDLTCPLSPDAAPDDELLSRGFKVCNDGRGKHHIPTRTAWESHIKHSHKSAWDYMERRTTDRYREEDRALQKEAIASQQEFMKAMMSRIAEAPVAPATSATVRQRRAPTSPTLAMAKHNHGAPYTRSWPDCPRCIEMAGAAAAFDNS